MARLPTPGGDTDQWGDVLNAYLSEAHNADGTAKDATGSSKGVIQLAGDLGGTASSPTVPALTTHINDPLGSGVHGFVTHDWGQDGWTPFTPVTISADGAQSFTQSVSNSRGVLTSTQPGNGSLRIAYLRANTNWVDSEMTSVIWGPSGTAWAGNNGQQGHIHRVREISPGVYEGIAFWTSVLFGFGGDYGFLHVNAVRWNGTTLLQGGGAGSGFGATDQSHFDRSVRVLGHLRFNFGIWINDYTVDQINRLKFLTSDIITISGMSDTTFNETDIALSSVDVNSNLVRVTDPTHTTAVSYTPDGSGTIRPSGTSSQKRWVPYVLSTRVMGGTSTAVPVEAKRWRLGEPEPDWGDSRVMRGTVIPDPADPTVDIPEIALGPGHCALWGAHFYNGSAGEWGDLRFRQL